MKYVGTLEEGLVHCDELMVRRQDVVGSLGHAPPHTASLMDYQ